MFDPFFSAHPPKKPRDLSALAQLQAAYAQLSAQMNPHRPWTQEEAITIGRLFVLAWGRAPMPSELRLGVYLPYPSTLKRLFGSVAAYCLALQSPGEPCGCTPEHRCLVAHDYYQQWQQNVHPTGILESYRMHLRAAGITPGKAVWSDATTVLLQEQKERPHVD